jgi:LuxR family maltose regulon positive regulatory protein
VLEVLQTPPPLPAEAVLTTLLNDLASLPDPVVLVLDDYHVITGSLARLEVAEV